MMNRHSFSKLLATAALIALGGIFSAVAQLNHPIALVEIGDPMNPANTNGHGQVANSFYMGQFEVTLSQYADFLNSVAKVSDPHGLYNSNMGSDGNVGGLDRTGSAGDYTYSVVSGRENNPIPYIKWADAARMANWMNNGATFGGNTESGAYNMSLTTPTREPGATWWIPSYNEWYKAAYYDPTKGGTGYWTYTTRNDSAPGNNYLAPATANQANYTIDTVYSVTQSSTFNGNQIYVSPVGSFTNSSSYYGTFDQGGNLQEWNDTVYSSTERGVNGGTWNSFNAETLASTFAPGSSDPVPFSNQQYLFSFRLASSVPEPGTWSLLAIGLGAWIFCTRLKRKI